MCGLRETKGAIEHFSVDKSQLDAGDAMVNLK